MYAWIIPMVIGICLEAASVIIILSPILNFSRHLIFRNNYLDSFEALVVDIAKKNIEEAKKLQDKDFDVIKGIPTRKQLESYVSSILDNFRQRSDATQVKIGISIFLVGLTLILIANILQWINDLSWNH